MSFERRRFLTALAGVGSAVGLAGCSVGTEQGGDGTSGGSSDGSDDGGGETPAGDDGGDGGDGSDGNDGDGGTETSSGDETTPDESLERVLFGSPGAVTGQWDLLQPATNTAFDMALDEINEAGGPLGAEATKSLRDTAVDPQQARTVTRTLIEQDNAVAINGLFSSEIAANREWLSNQEVPVVSGWPGSSSLATYGGDNGTPDDLSDDDWIWRTIPGSSLTSLAMAIYARDQGYERIAVMSGSAEAQQETGTTFGRKFEQLGGTIVTTVDLAQDQPSYQSELSRVYGNDFDALFVGFNFDDGATLAQNWAQGGYETPLLGNEWATGQDFLDAMGDLLEGREIVSFEQSTGGPGYEDFQSRFTERAPDLTMYPWAITTYDAVVVCALALHRSGETGSIDAQRRAVQRNLRHVANPPGTEVTSFGDGKSELDAGNEINYQGAANNIDFTDFGNVFGAVNIVRATPDGYETVRTVSEQVMRDNAEEY
jgi:ABC-type branched-subunit amino acid transport system substrate-binding protein